MKLHEVSSQTLKGKEAAIIVTVDYDESKKCVSEIISFEVVSGKAVIDVTELFTGKYSDAGDAIVELIDWDLNYIAQREINDDVMEMEPVFNMANFTNQMLGSIRY